MTDSHSSFQPAAGALRRSDAVPREPGDDPVTAIEAQLDAGEGQLAARALLAAVVHGTFPDGSPLSAWLEQLSEQRRAKLITAFAHYPCFACRNGQESCAPCGGSGFSAAAQICGACAGLGEKRCDFCAGAGLATYNLMPLALWRSVLTARASRAMKYLNQLAAQPGVSAPLPEAAAVRRIQDLNKLLGVLENALAALRQLRASGIVAPETAASFIRSCKRPATAGITAIRETLRHLAVHYNQMAPALPPVDAANAEAKSEFYEDLAASAMFDGTGLSHQFLPVDASQHARIDHA